MSLQSNRIRSTQCARAFIMTTTFNDAFSLNSRPHDYQLDNIKITRSKQVATTNTTYMPAVGNIPIGHLIQ